MCGNSQISDHQSLMMEDEEDDYTGFDDFASEDREQFLKIAQANRDLRRQK